jgi:hypothetical protein
MLSKKGIYSRQQHARISHRQWLQHIANCAKHHLNPKDYCMQHGLSLKGFKHHDWLERRKQKQTSGNFALVKVVSEPVTVVSHYEIVFPRGVSLRVPTSSTLPAILKSLECYV